MPRVTDREGRPVSGQLPGLVEAIVVDNRDPEGWGRVRVKFPTLPDMPESSWARVLAPMAGARRGWVTIPEVDDEVLVAFLHGDIHHPVVLGGLYNGVDLPPYANEDGNDDLRVFQSRSGHRVTFDDTSGSERVELVTKDESVRVVWDAAGRSLQVYASQDIVVEAGNEVSFQCTDFVVDASGSVSLKAGSELSLQAGSSASVDGGGQLRLQAGTIFLN